MNFTTDFTEHLGIQIRLANRELLTFACIYRSPNYTDENNEQLTALIHQLDQTNSAYKLLVGDFNYGAISWQDNTATSAAETAFLDCLQNTYMNQHVEEPTRGRSGQNPSILDLIISNDPNIVSYIRYESPLGKSDHTCLVFNINCYKEAGESARKFYIYDKGDYEHMTAELSNIDWSKKIGWITDPEEAYEVFTETLSTLYEKYIPTKIVGTGNKYKKSYDKDTVRAIKKKHRAWQRYMETRSGQKYIEYVRQRNKVSKLTQKAQRDYEKAIAQDVKNNPKKFWKYVKTKTKSPCNIPHLYLQQDDLDKGLATEDKGKADVLADFYSSVFTNEPSGAIPNPKPQHITSVHHKSIFTEEKIKKETPCSEDDQITWTRQDTPKGPERSCYHHSQAAVLVLPIHNGEEKVANDMEKSKCLSNYQEREQTTCL